VTERHGIAGRVAALSLLLSDEAGGATMFMLTSVG